MEDEAEFQSPRRQYPNDGIVVRWGKYDAVKATNSGHDEVVRWLYEHTARANDSRVLSVLMQNAFDVGDLQLAEWLMAHGCPFSAPDALGTGRADVGLWLLRRGDLKANTPMMEGEAFVIWAGRGHLEMMQLLVKSHASLIAPNTAWSGFWQDAMGAACDQGHLSVVRWLLEHLMGSTITGITSEGVHNAAVEGHLELAQLLHSHSYGGCTADTMYQAAEAGHLPVVQWIHAQFGVEPGAKLFSEVPTFFDRSVPSAGGSAMNAAAINGHLEVVKFLHSLDEPENPRGRKRVRDENGKQRTTAQPERDGRKPWATNAAMDEAAAGGHLEVVQWLHANRTEGCTTVAMDGAAFNGHLRVVQWLHANRSEGCTTLAMNGAAACGHLEVVQWLHANRSEGCTTKAMDKAASHSHLDVVQWLHVNRSEGCTVKAMTKAAAHGHLKVAQWLHANRSEGCTDEALFGAVEDDHLRVTQWLLMTPNLHGGFDDYVDDDMGVMDTTRRPPSRRYCSCTGTTRRASGAKIWRKQLRNASGLPI
ncbi:hypothetical protein BBJ28_00013361 [Nothophytophthora sp. Chile5]|nr:hypothetical protein BBJ28_00013361 [Nothophytophthora sp. Chile5]